MASFAVYVTATVIEVNGKFIGGGPLAEKNAHSKGMSSTGRVMNRDVRAHAVPLAGWRRKFQSVIPSPARGGINSARNLSAHEIKHLERFLVAFGSSE